MEENKQVIETAQEEIQEVKPVEEKPVEEQPVEPVVYEVKKEPERDPVGDKKIEKGIVTSEKKGLWSKLFNRKRSIKPGRLAVLFLRNNGNAETLDVPVKDGMFSLYGNTYHEKTDCIYTMGKDRIPLAVLEEWSMFPIGTRIYEDQDIRRKSSQLQEHLMKGIRHAEKVRLEGGAGMGPLNMKQVILWGIIILVVIVVLMNYI